MKIRKGFVSNSSSSSFVVAFEKVPQYLHELEDMLGIDRDKAAAVWRDLQDQKPMTKKEVAEELASGWVYLPNQPKMEDYVPAYDPANTQPYYDGYNAYDKACTEFAKKAAQTFMKDYKGCKFFHFHYADEDGSFWSEMEHGGTFDKLPHIVISHH